HWLMKQPDLDEEALRLQVQGHDLVVLRQTMTDSVAPVTVTSPSGATHELTLSASEPGTWRATMPADELGLWQATGGDARRVVDGSNIELPRIVPVQASSVFHGDGWMGVKMRDASVVKGVG